MPSSMLDTMYSPATSPQPFTRQSLCVSGRAAVRRSSTGLMQLLCNLVLKWNVLEHLLAFNRD